MIAINGFALGGGLEAALAADYRVVAEQRSGGAARSQARSVPGLRRYGAPAAHCRYRSRDSAGSRAAATFRGCGAAAQALSTKSSALATLREASMRALRRAVSGDFDWKARRVGESWRSERIRASM